MDALRLDKLRTKEGLSPGKVFARLSRRHRGSAGASMQETPATHLMELQGTGASSDAEEAFSSPEMGEEAILEDAPLDFGPMNSQSISPDHSHDTQMPVPSRSMSPDQLQNINVGELKLISEESTGPHYTVRLVSLSKQHATFSMITRHIAAGTVVRVSRDVGPIEEAETRSSEQDKKKKTVKFRSRVVSRTHAEMWFSHEGQLYIRDLGSSSGTFVNNRRLSEVHVKSEPYPLADGDVLQLGVNSRDGTSMDRCVRALVVLGDGQWGDSAYVTERRRRLLDGLDDTECPICLSSLDEAHALFAAPCLHMFHFKCIYPLVASRYPVLCCPVCRTYFDLEDEP